MEGLFLVESFNKGGEENDYGWSFIEIENNQTINLGYFEDVPMKLEKRRIVICSFDFGRNPNATELNSIACAFRRGFGIKTSHNFGEKQHFISASLQYLRSLRDKKS